MRAARRHSRFVRFARAVIPVSIVLGVGLFAAYKWFDPWRILARLPISTDGVVISGNKIVMKQPQVKGFTEDQRPYRVVARFAAQDPMNPDITEFQDVQATVV